jgi:hypothetical protein
MVKDRTPFIDTVYRNNEFLFVRNDTDPSLFSKYREDPLCNHQYSFLQPMISQPTDDTRSVNPQQVYDADDLYLVSDASLHPITS